MELDTKDKNGKSIRKQFEVDFVINVFDKRYYLQSAFSIPDEEKMKQETASFRNINDVSKRVVIVRDNISPFRNEKRRFVYRIV